MKKIRIWIARRLLLRHLYWLESGPHSMAWYTKAFSLAHWVYPCSKEDARDHWPLQGVGFNALETEVFWDDVEGY